MTKVKALPLWRPAGAGVPEEGGRREGRCVTEVPLERTAKMHTKTHTKKYQVTVEWTLGLLQLQDWGSHGDKATGEGGSREAAPCSTPSQDLAPLVMTQPISHLGAAGRYVPDSHCFYSLSLFPGCAHPAWCQPLLWKPQVQTQGSGALRARNV